MRKPNPQTHQACRSLLQKAVRRGDTLLTRNIAYHLHSIGDNDWLKMRTAIITFEECWPLGVNLSLASDFGGIVDALIKVTQMVKVKDAAGLGVLAYELSEGDTSMLSGSLEDQHIRQVAEAVKNPKDFWIWVTHSCSQADQQLLIQSSMKAYRRGGWPWDRALTQAAAYLAGTSGVPEVHLTDHPSIEVPFWVGLDKHTPQGKKALQDTAKHIGVPSRQLTWISFYCESAYTNESTESYWWSRELRWRLSKVGVDQDKARQIWEKAQPVYIRLLKEETDALQKHLEYPLENEAVVENETYSPTQQVRLPGF